MFRPFFLAAAAAILFYAMLPVAGAFLAREQWRRFRRAVTEAAALPPLSGAVAGSEPDGPCLVAGEIEAIGAGGELWVRSGQASCVVDLSGTWVYAFAVRAGTGRVERRRWSGIPSIGPGARAFVAGRVRFDGGRLRLDGSGASLAMIHDGDDDDIVGRAVWAGRHENEYWNPVTQVSIVLGAAAMGGILSLAISERTPSLVTAMTLIAAFSPVLPLLPPGVVGFLAYRKFWKQARYLRARRDVEALDPGRAGEVRSLRARARRATLASASSFVGALAVNAALALALLRSIR